MTTPTAAIVIERLTLHDTCDRCGTQAYVRLAKLATTIDFCAHDYAVHAEKLLLTGWEVAHDTRHTLA